MALLAAISARSKRNRFILVYLNVPLQHGSQFVDQQTILLTYSSCKRSVYFYLVFDEKKL